MNPARNSSVKPGRSRWGWTWWLLKWSTFNLCMILLICYVAFYRPYRKRIGHAALGDIVEVSKREGIPLGVMHSIGKFDHSPLRHLGAYKREHPGVIRILALGDSFTLGAEALPGNDYPSLLAALFKADGFENIEVINAGNNWVGIGQTYRMWTGFLSHFEPDFVLLGPGTFISDREDAFNHTEDVFPGYLHGRYVLDGADVRYLDVLGDANMSDRENQYYSFLPKWQYLRYDRNPPAFLKAFLPAGRVIGNPFYYTSLNRGEEHQQIFERLLRRFESDRPTVFTHMLYQNRSLFSDINSSLQMDALPIYQFPYIRTVVHLSAAGNLAVAQAAYQALTRRAEIGVDLVEIFDVSSKPDATRVPESLDVFSHADLKMGNEVAASFLHTPHDRGFTGAGDHPVVFDKEGIKSLLGFQLTSTNIADEYFLPLQLQLKPGMNVVIDLNIGGVHRRTELGPIQFPNAGISVGSVPCAMLARDPSALNLLYLDGVSVQDQARLVDGDLLVDTQKVAHFARRGANVVLEPLWNDWVFARPTESTFFRVTSIPNHGELRLALSGSASREFPIARFELSTKRLAYRRDAVKRYIRPSRGDAALAELAN